jgi:PAS domain S-box-containing protein
VTRNAHDGRRRGTLPRELVPIGVGVVVGFVVAVELSLFETLDQWRRSHESLEVVVLTVCAVIALIALSGYSWQRHRVARAEAINRDAAERALIANNERIESLFEYHPHAVYSLDLQGRFLDVNAACERLTGFSREDLRGMDSTVFSAPGDEEMARATLEDIAHGKARVFETSIQSKDGEVLDLRITGVPTVADDEVVGMYGIAEDVTAANTMRRDLESARVAAEQASVAKSLFIANVSHELRTPLTSVLAASEMLRETAPNPEQEGLLDYIDRPGHRLLRLVEDLLDFSRIQAGKAVVEPVEFDLGSALQEVVEYAAHAAGPQGLEFSFTIDPDVPATMVSDETRITQVLTNLIENAIKFTESGTVRLHVTTSAEGARDMVRFDVTDTGIGITEEHLAELFDSFSQADPSMTRRYGGTGLGLAICKALVALMGGSIEVSSVEGEGSTFSVLLPRRPETDPTTDPAPQMVSPVEDANRPDPVLASRSWTTSRT